MSLQITTGAGSLIGVGIGAGDAATIITLASRIGNWWNSSSGDQAFLELLNEDEMNILKRRGLLDLAAFNKRWRKTMRLLANDRPMQLEGSDADSVLDQLSRFTAVMICIVATLEAFTTWSAVKSIVKDVLRALLRTTELGEDMLTAQYQQRVNSWRSAACIRTLSVEATRFRQSLLDRDLVLHGLMGFGDSKEIVDFLVWLLSGESDSWMTASSDVAGIAACIAWLGIDILSVKGVGYGEAETRCYVVYSESVILQRQEGVMFAIPTLRHPCTTVSLLHPEEAIAAFPLSLEGHNQCRRAWLLGQKAAASIGIGVVLPDRDDRRDKMPHSKRDVTYTFTDLGAECGRAGDSFGLAADYAIATNDETVSALETVMQDENKETISWLLERQRNRHEEEMESETNLGSGSKTFAFSIMQSFFLGYYYAVFLRIVDTKSLALQTVEGAWRFRSMQLLGRIQYMLAKSRKARKTEKRSSGLVSRQELITVLSQLFLGQVTDIENIEPTASSGERWCLGIVQNRTLLVNSLINACGNPSEVGRFVLLDVDVGGVPRDMNGLIRSGIPDVLDHDVVDTMEDPASLATNIVETKQSPDISLHIEAAWDHNPDCLLLCARYKGRRLATISPARADSEFLESWVESVGHPSASPFRKALLYDLIEDLSLRTEPLVPISIQRRIPTIVQVHGAPRARYAAVSLCGSFMAAFIASNCLDEAFRFATSRQAPVKLIHQTPFVIIGTLGKDASHDKVYHKDGEQRMVLIEAR